MRGYNVAKKILTVLITVLLGLAVSGCATIINGTSQKIQVISEPAGAAVIADDKSSYITPVKLRLERRRDHTLVFSKDGYESQTIKLMHVISEAVAGNTLCWGPLGWVFDICAGTQYKLQPDPVHVVLKQK